MTQTSSTDCYEISGLSGEFVDPDAEGRFRAFIGPYLAQFLARVLVAWGVIWLLFAVSDYTRFGLSETFYWWLAGRAAWATAMFVCAYFVVRDKSFDIGNKISVWVAIVGFTLFYLNFFFTPLKDLPWLVILSMLTIMVIYLLLPTRLINATIASVYGLVGTAVAVAVVVPDTSVLRITLLVLILALPLTAGYLAARRFEVVRRRAFAASEQTQQEIEDRRRMEAELKQQATTDPLTGACNRRQYEELFLAELARARRHNRPLSLAVLDLDHFKRVNDVYGHNAGDAALITTASVCRAALRESDVLGRLGGEEFILIFPDTTVEQAVAVAERLRLRLAETDVVAGESRFRLTATIGVTALRPTDETINDLVLRADEALYSGKEAGRDQVCAG